MSEENMKDKYFGEMDISCPRCGKKMEELWKDWHEMRYRCDDCKLYVHWHFYRTDGEVDEG